MDDKNSSSHESSAVQEDKQKRAISNDGVVARRIPQVLSGAGTRSIVSSSSTNSIANLTTWTPSHRRLAIAAGKAGISIADGVLLANSAINPAVTAAFVLYECVLAIQDYRHGALNALGYRTTKRDVALRIGKEVIGAGIGIGIGQAVGAVLGLTALPVVGQMITTAVISVGLGIFVGALLTHYADRAFTRLQIRGQYRYPSNERGAQARFEEILEELHDLSSIEACRIVQHYMEYRVASGWESATDGDDYRAAGYPPHLLPRSLQHFTAVRLQRKWGFINERQSCRKLYRALLLQHHPDRGGDAAIAAQLTNDYETYAFCRGWWNDCRSFLQSAAATDPSGGTESDRPIRRGNPVWNFFRTLFFAGPRNSETLAQDLHAHNFLQLPGSSTSCRSPSRTDALDYPDQSTSANSNGESIYPDLSELERSIQQEESNDFSGDTVMTLAQQSAAVSRVLSGLHQRYQNVVEMINYTALLRVIKDREKRTFLLSQAELFSQTQSILHCQDECGASSHNVSPVWGIDRKQNNQDRSLTMEKVIELREQCRRNLIEHVFTEDVKGSLTQALELWRTAKELVSNFLQCSTNGKPDSENPSSLCGSLNNTSTIIDTLLTIQAKLEDVPANWSESIDNADIIMSQDSGLNSNLSDLKIIGLAASSALGGEHAKTMRESVEDLCESYVRVWRRKQETYWTLEDELRLVQAQLSVHLETAPPISPSTPTASQIPSSNVALLKENEHTYANQLFLLEQQLYEVDSLFEELLAICARHLPEHRHLLSRLPSTVLWGISVATDHDSEDYHFSFGEDGQNSKIVYSRRIHHERELHLSFYQNMQEELENPLEPCMPRLWNASATSLFSCKEVMDICNPEHLEVCGNIGFTLLRATRVNPVSAAKSFYWIKQYNLNGIRVCQKEVENSNGQTKNGTENRIEIKGKTKEVRLYVANRLLQDELNPSCNCESSLILSPREVFSESRGCTINFLIRREPTQQRFRSVRNVQTHIMPLGLRWLHEALQCVIDLHVCNTPHGNVRLSNFVYDSFGRVSLGCFSPFHTFQGVQKTAGDAYDRDKTDFGIMILSEIMPYLSVLGGDDETQSYSQQVYNVYKEIGERLVAKVQPSFSLKDARSFVCRCLQVPVVDTLGANGGINQSFPVEWGPKPLTDYVHLEPLASTSFLTTHYRSYRNINPPLWQRYSHYRHAISKASPPPPPTRIISIPHFLYCSDEMEVNERFLWCRCPSQEHAWNLCYNGIGVPDGPWYQKGFTMADIHACLHQLPFLSLSHPLKSANELKDNELIIIFRVALGTVVPGEMSSAAKREKSQFYCVNDVEVAVLCSNYACYPEIVLRPLPS